MNKIYLVVFVLLLSMPLAIADLRISKVLYDPSGTEAGGEALEIINYGNTTVDLDGLVIATSNSKKDAVISGKSLLPNQKFLVADENWNSSRDTLDWRLADHAEKITLGNSKGGVSLVKDDIVLDVVGWGEEEELFSVSTANKTSTGLCLVRVSDSGNNRQDFVEGNCSFFDGESLLLTAIVEPGFSAWINSHSAPYKVHAGEVMEVFATDYAEASFAGSSYELVENNGSFSASIDTSGITAGNYSLIVGDVHLDVHVLPVRLLTINKRKVNLDPSDSVVLTNSGSVVSTVFVDASDLRRASDSISKENILVNGVSLSDKQKFSIAPGDKLRLDIVLSEVDDAPPGVYESVFRIIYGS